MNLSVESTPIHSFLSKHLLVSAGSQALTLVTFDSVQIKVEVSLDYPFKRYKKVKNNNNKIYTTNIIQHCFNSVLDLLLYFFQTNSMKKCISC